jgi:hypothetical protein
MVIAAAAGLMVMATDAVAPVTEAVSVAEVAEVTADAAGGV